MSLGQTLIMESKAFDDSIANGGILWVMGDAPCSRNHQMTLLFE
jgi:hypothetical protein